LLFSAIFFFFFFFFASCRTDDGWGCSTASCGWMAFLLITFNPLSINDTKTFFQRLSSDIQLSIFEFGELINNLENDTLDTSVTAAARPRRRSESLERIRIRWWAVSLFVGILFVFFPVIFRFSYMLFYCLLCFYGVFFFFPFLLFLCFFLCVWGGGLEKRKGRFFFFSFFSCLLFSLHFLSIFLFFLL